jgi:phosphoglycolate phosphatase-like HAD superfamily hydrolase
LDLSSTNPARFAGVRALVFDLDGTLIDSKLDLALSVNATLKHMGRPQLPDERISGYVGQGAMRLIERRWPLETLTDRGLVHVDRVYTVLNKLGIVPLA